MTVARFADRLRQTSLTTGTGNLTLGAADTGFRAISTEFTTGEDLSYCIEGLDAMGELTGQWEVGRGELNGGGQLVRSVVFASSSGGLVNFTSASLRVFVTVSADGLDEWYLNQAHTTDAQHGTRGGGTLHPAFTSGVAGFAPASGGGTVNFLRADGTWAAPGSSGYTSVEEDGVAVTARTVLNFVGDTFTVSDVSSKTRVVANDFTSATRGVVPASGGGTTNFLRADGTWASPGGGMSIGGAVTSGTVGSILFVGTGPTLAQDNAQLFWDDTANYFGIGGTPSHKLHLQAGTLATGVRALLASATLSPSASTELAYQFGAVTAGSGVVVKQAAGFDLSGTYVGGGRTTTLTSTNTVAGTGATPLGASSLGNYSTYSLINGVGAGHNVSSYMGSTGSTARNFGAVISGYSSTGSPTNFGLYANAFSLGGSPVLVGLMASLYGQTDTIGTLTSAAFIADNAAIAAPIWLGRDNGTTVYALADGGQQQGIDGTVSVPAWSLLTDTDTGLYSGVANELYITTGGVRRVRVTATGSGGNPLVWIEGTSTMSSLLYVTSTPAASGGTQGAIQANGTAQDTAAQFFVTHAGATGGANQAVIDAVGPTIGGFTRFGVSYANSTFFGKRNITAGVAFFGSDALSDVVLGRGVAVAEYQRLTSVGTVFNEQGADLDFRVEGDTNANLFMVDASVDRVGFGTATPSHFVDVQAGSLASSVRAVGVTTTLSATAAAQVGLEALVTSSGSAAGCTPIAARFNLEAGYTGAGLSAGLVVNNNAVGTGTGVFNDTGNFGVYAVAIQTTAGSNVGGVFVGQAGNLSIGVHSRATAVKNSATNIGALILGRNTGTTPIEIGAFISMQGALPTFTGLSSALVVDNSDRVVPIALFRDNAATVFTLADGMTAVSFGTGFDRDASGTYAIGATNITTLTLGRTGQTVSMAGSATVATTFTVSSLGLGVAHVSSGGVFSSSAVLLGSEVSGTLPIANGGTGQTTANAAFNALAPAQTGNAGKFLTTDATNTSWAFAVSALGAIGAAPNANGATLTGATLNLEPASASFGGVVTTGTQTLAGAKTFSGVLTSSGGFVATSGVSLTTASISATTTLDATNHTVLASASGGAITVNLPAAASHSGRRYEIKKTDSSANTVTIDGSGAETIDGAATYVLNTQYQSVTIVSDGTSWFVV